MRKLLAIALIGLLLAGCCKTKCHVPPGQVQKATGYNPASGKVHIK